MSVSSRTGLTLLTTPKLKRLGIRLVNTFGLLSVLSWSIACLTSSACGQIELRVPPPPADDRPAASDADADTSTDAEIPQLSSAAEQLLQGMALLLLPQTYTDDDDWGGTQKIQSGLNVDVDGLKVHTSRRWKHVNHGRWRRVDATLVDPENHFRMSVRLLPRTEQGEPRYRIHARLRLRATGRQQQWLLGAKIYSISADAVADLSVNVDLHFATSLQQTDDGRRLRILPVIENSQVRVDGLNIRRISHWKGGPVREFGHIMDGMVRAAARRKSAKLTDKINAKIERKPERFEIPAGIFYLFGGKDAEDVAGESTEAETVPAAAVETNQQPPRR